MDEDLYDFSGVTLDLQLLQSELMTLQTTRDNTSSGSGGFFSTSLGGSKRGFEAAQSSDDEVSHFVSHNTKKMDCFT